MRIGGERAQFSLEGILVVGMAIIVFLSLAQLAMERKSMAIDVGESGEIRMTGELLASAIDTIYANGNGSRITLTSADIDYAYLENTLDLSSIEIKTAQKAILLTKTMSRTGGESWTTNVSIVTGNITTGTPSASFPETTLVNRDNQVVIYTDKIAVS